MIHLLILVPAFLMVGVSCSVIETPNDEPPADEQEVETLPRIAYSRKECARMLGVSLAWLAQRIASGELNSTKRHGRRIIAADDLHDFAKGRVGLEKGK